MEDKGLWDFDDLLTKTKHLLADRENQETDLCRQFDFW